MRILIADDAAVIRAALRRMAAAAGHEIVGEARNAEETLALARAVDPEAVAVDGRLPPGDAAPVIARLRDLLPRARLIVIAALDEMATVRAARAAGATGALLRPILPGHVVRAFEARP